MIEIPDEPVVLLHAGCTLFMAGLIWFVQIVHYPLFALVGQDAFPSYEASHQRRTTLVVGPVMMGELVSAIALAVDVPPGVHPSWTWAGLVLLAVIWFSTVFLQVPCHRALQRTFDRRTLRALVASNWIRTAAWSARAVLSLLVVARVLSHSATD